MSVQGFLDEASHVSINGWAWDPAKPQDDVVLVVTIDGVPVRRVVANIYRPDLEAAGIGDGRHGFVLDAGTLKLPIAPAVVHVQVEGTMQDLRYSPARLEGPIELNRPAQEAITALIDSPGSDEVLQTREQFLAQQVELLLRRLSERHTDRRARAVARSRKWRWRPADGPAPPSLTARALVLDGVTPKPARDAGSNAIMSHMQSLQRLGYQVTFAPADMQPGGGTAALAAMGIATHCEPWCGSVEEILRRQAGEFDLVYLHRVSVATLYLPLVRQHMPRARVLFSVADLHSVRLLRQAQVEDRPELVPHANYVLAQELTAAANSHAVLTHSTVEAALLRQRLPQADIHVVPWAIPSRPTAAGFEARHGVGFVGSYGHAPNLDAALWLMDEIMPLVWLQGPDIACIVAGSAMPEAVRRQRDKRITTLPDLDDLDGLFGRVRLTVAPLAYGAGLKGKVADSLAAGVPCVCTPVAAEGFDLPEPLRALVASDAAGLAAAIVRAHSDAAVFEACREAGLAFVAREFGKPAVDAAMRSAAGLPLITPAATPGAIDAALAGANDPAA